MLSKEEQLLIMRVLLKHRTADHDEAADCSELIEKLARTVPRLWREESQASLEARGYA